MKAAKQMRLWQAAKNSTTFWEEIQTNCAENLGQNWAKTRSFEASLKVSINIIRFVGIKIGDSSNSGLM